jgi:hypothetical protein
MHSADRAQCMLFYSHNRHLQESAFTSRREQVASSALGAGQHRVPCTYCRSSSGHCRSHLPLRWSTIPEFCFPTAGPPWMGEWPQGGSSGQCQNEGVLREELQWGECAFLYSLSPLSLQCLLCWERFPLCTVLHEMHFFICIVLLMLV